KSSPAQQVILDITHTEQAQPLVFSLEPLADTNFSYHWEEDQSTAGTDYSAHINQPLQIEFLNETLEVVDDRPHYSYNTTTIFCSLMAVLIGAKSMLIVC